MMFVEIDNMNFPEKNLIERNSNENNKYLKGWEVKDPTSNITKEVEIEYFLSDDEIDIFYNDEKKILTNLKISESLI